MWLEAPFLLTALERAMALPPADDDASTGTVTQGGNRGSAAPAPARGSGRSAWWAAAVMVIAIVVLVFWVTAEHKRAPAEAGTTRVSGATGAGPPSLPARLR